MDSAQLAILFLMILVAAGAVFYFSNRDLSKYGNRTDRHDRSDRDNSETTPPEEQP